MKPETKQVIGIALVVALSMAVLIFISNAVRESHDAEVRKQTIETCKEVR